MEKEVRGRGRPAKPDEEKNVVIAVSVPPDLAEFAKELGDGKLSRGVQAALSETRNRKKKTTKQGLVAEKPLAKRGRSRKPAPDAAAETLAVPATGPKPVGKRRPKRKRD